MREQRPEAIAYNDVVIAQKTRLIKVGKAKAAPKSRIDYPATHAAG